MKLSHYLFTKVLYIAIPGGFAGVLNQQQYDSKALRIYIYIIILVFPRTFKQVYHSQFPIPDLSTACVGQPEQISFLAAPKFCLDQACRRTTQNRGRVQYAAILYQDECTKKASREVHRKRRFSAKNQDRTHTCYILTYTQGSLPNHIEKPSSKKLIKKTIHKITQEKPSAGREAMEFKNAVTMVTMGL